MTLREWMNKNRYGTHTFARLLSDFGVKVSPQTVLNWCNGSLPRKKYREAIQEATGGQVTPASFL